MRRHLAPVVLALVLLAAASASAQECVTCWTDSCRDLESYGRPACSAGTVTPTPAPTRKKPRPTPQPQATPRRTLTAPVACSEGKLVNPDTQGHCCWPGQAWGEGKCLGIPTRCPEGLVPDKNKQGCGVAECLDGQKRMHDGIHCCWEGQAWSTARRACVGVPSCPPGYLAEGESCRVDLAPKRALLAQAQQHAQLAQQHAGEALSFATAAQHDAQEAGNQATLAAQPTQQAFHIEQVNRASALAQQAAQLAETAAQETAQASQMTEADAADPSLKAGGADFVREAQRYADQAKGSLQHATQYSQQAQQAAQQAQRYADSLKEPAPNP